MVENTTICKQLESMDSLHCTGDDFSVCWLSFFKNIVQGEKKKKSKSHLNIAEYVVLRERSPLPLDLCGRPEKMHYCALL